MERRWKFKLLPVLGPPRFKFGLFVLFMLGFAQLGLTQQLTRVDGQVVNESGGPMTGVSVAVKNGSTSTFTDEQGKFGLDVGQQDTLLFTYVGFVPQEVAVLDKTNLDVVMVESQSALDEVVVVGYGTQKKANLTGAVATMDSKQLSVVPAANVSSLIAGNLPGLMAVQRSGEPGNDDVSFNIRGFGSPLIVVDGIVGRNFSRLDPNEIESITVLKDAASTAVYGVSGGNGVVLVTTKKGTVGKPEFNYTFNYGLQHVTNYPRFVTSEEFAILKNEAAVNAGGVPVFSEEEVEKFRNGSDPLNYPNVDYYDLFVRDYTPQVQHNATVRGGSDRIKYFFLLGQTDQVAMWKGDNQDYRKYNFRSNVDAQITDGLRVSLDLGARTENRNNLVQDAYLMASWMQYQWPIVNPYTPDGKIQNSNYGLIAYLDRDLTGYIRNQVNAIQGNLTIDYQIPFVPGLSAKVTGVRDLYFEDRKQWMQQYGLYTWDPVTETSTQTGARESNTLDMNSLKTVASRIQASLNYSRSFLEDHTVGAMVLYEEMEDISSSLGGTRLNYVVPIDQIFAGPALNQTNRGTASDNGRQSIVGRFNYDYKNKYLLEYSFRYDGSPRFPPGYRWGYFSGYSAGWRISDERFFSRFTSVVDNLKLRASYGQLGNDNTGNFQFLAGYSFPAYSYILGGSSVTNGLVDVGITNPNITWEEINMLNLGVDVSLWNGLLTMEADVFSRWRKNILSKRALQIPSTFGASLPDENLNEDLVRGFEIVLGHNNRINEVAYNISGNISFTRAKFTYVEQGSFNSQYHNWRSNEENRYTNRFNGLKAIGQFRSYDEIKSAPIQDGYSNSTLRPGDIRYDDFNGDGAINAEDYQPIGRGYNPEINFGINMGASWKNLSVSMLWQGSANFSMYQEHYLVQPFANDMSTYAYFMDRWRLSDINDPNSEWIPGKYPATINDGAPNNKMLSSFWLQDASYIRLKSLNITYRITAAAFSKIGVKDLAFTLSGYNLLTFTGMDYMDPESPTGRLSYYPQQKTYNAGVNITF